MTKPMDAKRAEFEVWARGHFGTGANEQYPIGLEGYIALPGEATEYATRVQDAWEAWQAALKAQGEAEPVYQLWSGLATVNFESREPKLVFDKWLDCTKENYYQAESENHGARILYTRPAPTVAKAGTEESIDIPPFLRHIPEPTIGAMADAIAEAGPITEPVCNYLTRQLLPAMARRDMFVTNKSAPAEPVSVPEGWQPIETAPKNKDVLVLAEADGLKRLVAHWHEGSSRYVGRQTYFDVDPGWYYWAHRQYEKINPSLWAPLAAAPAAGGES